MDYMESEGFCSVDGILLDQHERCHRCQILVGPGHWEQGQKCQGRILCGWCMAELALDLCNPQAPLVAVDSL